MENFINELRISNFKSIREARLDCGRINLFVGKPNVGKSNVLEAMSLYCSPFSKSKKFLNDFIRYERFKNLFYYYDTKNPVYVNSNIGGTIIFQEYKTDSYDMFIGPSSAINMLLNEKNKRGDFINQNRDIAGNIKAGTALIQDNGEWKTYFNDDYSPVKKYTFDPTKGIDERERSFLLPPHGTNLFAVMETNKKLRQEIPGLFEEYKLEFLIDPERSSFDLIRKEEGFFRRIPYALIADTLQRIIFHYAAIFSNRDSVILFEEPESHSFPPYVRELALKIVESLDNQFFITTHSPHLFTTIVEETAPNDLAVFLTYFEDYETKFKKLETEDINEILNYGVDIFFNQKWFLNEKGTENFA